MRQLVLLCLFAVCVVFPNLNLGRVDELDVLYGTYWGVLHIPSLVFILLAFGVLSAGSWGLGGKEKGRKYLKKAVPAAKLLVEAEDSGVIPKQLIGSVSNPMLERVNHAVKCGFGPERTAELITAEVSDLRQLVERRMRSWGHIVGALPFLGMTGTIAGLMFMFGGANDALDGQVDLSALSTALLTTLYASLVTVLWSKPMQQRVTDALAEVDHATEQLIRYSNAIAARVTALQYRQAVEAGNAK